MEFEWNPFSRASRAARAERAGQIGVALRLYTHSRQRRRIHECLHAAVPNPRVRALLINAINELLELEQAATSFRAIGAPDAEVMAAQLTNEARRALPVLWHTADRVSAATAHQVDSATIQHRLQSEADNLASLLAAIQEARRRLAEFILAGNTDVEIATMEFRAIGAAAEELRRSVDGPSV